MSFSGVIDIEREVELGGPIHSKGVLILSGYLSSHFSKNDKLALSASLVFEQSYGMIDGDSASVTELCALLSSVSGVPINQSFAITGSINQRGEVQAIGCVNEKIEGFFDICKVKGLTGKQGVLIPASNVKHLMLQQDVIDAAKAKNFHIYPISHVNEAMMLLTGMSSGARNKKGVFPKTSLNYLVEKRLLEYANISRSEPRR